MELSAGVGAVLNGEQAMSQREQWGTRAGFILAAVGSAIGLGNIWRFPYVTYENGGGAFIVPYLVALLTAGIPLLVLEYTIGHKYRGSAPLSFYRMSRPVSAIGWWQAAVCFVIAVYYPLIIAWALRYTGFSLSLGWGNDPDAFLFENFLNVAEEPGFVSSYVGGVFWPLVIVWVIVLGLLLLGVHNGIERANKVFIPLLVLMFGVLVVRAITLDGASLGLDALFAPDWSALGNGTVWVAAYGQVFFSLSVGFGVMVTYASYLRRRSDLTGSAVVAGFANSSFEILAGIGVFATIGFLAASSGVGIGEVATDGLGLAFVAFPTIISTLPTAPELFGVLFFGSLVLAGLTSLISLVQMIVAAIEDRFNMARTPAVLLVGGGAAAVSLLLLPTREGLYILDSADHFINAYGIVAVALALVIAVAWVLRRLEPLRAHANETSAVPLGRWWLFMLGVVTPVMLGWILLDSLRTELAENYEGYPTVFLLVTGGGVVVGALVIGILAALPRWPEDRAAEEPVAWSRAGRG